MRARDRLVVAAYAAGWAVTRQVPERLAHAAFAQVADVAWRRRVSGVRQLERNLRRVVPEADPVALRELSRAGMRSYFRYWCEFFRLPSWRPADIVDRVVVHEEDRFRAAMARGRGVVAALPHTGNWDLAGAWACVTGTPLTTVAQRVEPERLFRRFVASREALGMEILALSGGPPPLDTLARRLREGRLVCLVADRDLSRRGVEVTFFGEPTRMPAGPAALAYRTGASLLPVTLWHDGPRLHVRFEPSVEPKDGAGAIRDMTQRVAEVFAAGIAARPQDWHMLQPLWLADLAPREEAARR